ncbi:MAG: tetratricopeptide repeat protein, partial [Myxococcota bacterium]|nr:tetratricopeptide repeat protein [Myxococcota bacterium]
MTALVLSIALSLTLACPAADAATPAGEAAMPAANDPLGVIALADALGSEGRNDEALAVLRSALDTPALVSEASDRLTRLLVRSPPRRAWALGYGSAAALDGDNDLLKRIVAQSMLQDPSPRVRVEGARTLDALRQASPEDEAGRIAAGDAWLRLGRPDQAMEAYGAGGGKKLSQRRAAALLAMGRYKRAAENAPRAVPEACRVAATPVACALGLADMGFPGAAAGRLERELRNRHPTLRSRAQRAAGYGTLGALHVRSGQPDRAIRAWQDSMANQPSEDVRRKLVDALLASGRVGTARRYVDLDDPCIERGDCPARAVKAVVVALSVDVSGDGPAVARAIGEAERLDRDQPIVARRAARFHLERDRPEAALGLLEPLLRSQADDEAFLRLYSRVAMALDRPALAVDAWRAGMAAARTPKPFARRLVRYADHQVRAAEASKDAGRSEDARVRYMLALTPSPGDGDRLCGLGGALWAGGRMEQAEKAYRTVLEQEADNPVALRSLVLLLQGRGDLAGARQLLESHDLDHPRLTHLSHELRSLARAVEVASLREAGSPAEALARVEALLADGPNDVRLLKLRADLLGELGRHVDAAETYRMARSVDTMDDPYITLGEVYALLAIQQVDEARALIDTVSFAGPAGADARAAERAVERGEAAIALAEGRDSDAMAIYIQL